MQKKLAPPASRYNDQGTLGFGGSLTPLELFAASRHSNFWLNTSVCKHHSSVSSVCFHLCRRPSAAPIPCLPPAPRRPFVVLRLSTSSANERLLAPTACSEAPNRLGEWRRAADRGVHAGPLWAAGLLAGLLAQYIRKIHSLNSNFLLITEVI